MIQVSSLTVKTYALTKFFAAVTIGWGGALAVETVSDAAAGLFERGIAGSLLLVVGYAVVRWVFKASERSEQSMLAALNASEARAEAAEKRETTALKILADERAAHAATRAERDIAKQRLADLERRGIQDRRQPSPDDFTEFPAVGGTD